MKVEVKQCLLISLSVLEAKVCTLRDCFAFKIDVLYPSLLILSFSEQASQMMFSHSLSLTFTSRKLRKDPTVVLKALGKSCKCKTSNCGGLSSDPWCAEGHEEIMRL